MLQRRRWMFFFKFKFNAAGLFAIHLSTSWSSNYFYLTASYLIPDRFFETQGAVRTSGGTEVAFTPFRQPLPPWWRRRRESSSRGVNVPRSLSSWRITEREGWRYRNWSSAWAICWTRTRNSRCWRNSGSWSTTRTERPSTISFTDPE